MQFYTTEKIGQTQELTPEGFLLCRNVPIARTGSMTYGPDETPIPVGPSGVVIVTRDAKEVFRPEFVASFAGKPLVSDHPMEDVNPSNWKQYSVGTVFNPRPAGAEAPDLLLADLLICDASAIQEVRAGKREVSAGYEAEYEETAPGQGRQYDLLANHVALVEAGRCGPRCAIGDRKTSTTGATDTMKTRDNATVRWYDGIAARVRAAFKAKDEAGMEEALKEGEKKAEDAAPGGEALHLHLGAVGGEGGNKQFDELSERVGMLEGGMAGINDSLEEIKGKLGGGANPGGENKDAEAEEAVEEQLAEEAPAGAQDAARKARDSVYLGDSFQDTLALAEVLVPGIKVPTYDSKASAKSTLDAICALRRTAIDLAYAQPEGRAIVDQLLGGKPLELAKMSCKDTRSLFRAAATARKAANSAAFADAGKTVVASSGGGLGVRGAIRSAADLNKANSKHYGLPN